MSDPAAAYAALRDETAVMFGYDLANLSLTQGLQLDLVSLLRLEVDTMQGQVLAGDTVDLNRLVMAHGMLQKMLPERALVAPAPAPESRFGPSARERLRRLIETTVLAPPVDDPVELERKAELMRREEMAAIVAAGGSIEPAPSIPAPVAPPPPERPENVVPFVDATARANSTLPPAGYLKQREPWESYHDGNSMGPHPWPLPR
jgi:hypothetical protein